MRRTEIEIDITSRRAWLGLALLCLVLPRFGRGSEDAAMSNFYASPAGVYRTMLVTGSSETVKFAPGSLGAEPSKVYVFDDPTKGAPSSTNARGKLGIGVMNPANLNARVHIHGHVRVSGCIWINDSVKCGWDTNP